MDQRSWSLSLSQVQIKKIPHFSKNVNISMLPKYALLEQTGTYPWSKLSFKEYSLDIIQ